MSELAELRQALHRLVVVAFRRRAAGKRLYIERYDGDDLVPSAEGKAVVELLLSGPLITTTRTNVRLHIDDGGTREPPFDFESVTGLRGWTVRCIQEWLDSVVPWIRSAHDVEAEFARIYEAFQQAYRGDTYTWRWISSLDNFAIHDNRFAFNRVDLDDGLVIRWLQEPEYELLKDHWTHQREGPPSRYALVLERRLAKDQPVSSLGVNARSVRDRVVFCLRVALPSPLWSTEIAATRETCWGPSFVEGAYAPPPPQQRDRLRAVLDEFHAPGLRKLWAAVRSNDSSRFVFLATKLAQLTARTGDFDRITDSVVALEKIFGKDIARFSKRIAWTIGGYEDSEKRERVGATAREAYQFRNAWLHGDMRRLQPWLGDPQRVAKLVEDTWHLLQRGIQLDLLNPDFRSHLDEAANGVPISWERLP